MASRFDFTGTDFVTRSREERGEDEKEKQKENLLSTIPPLRDSASPRDPFKKLHDDHELTQENLKRLRAEMVEWRKDYSASR